MKKRDSRQSAFDFMEVEEKRGIQPAITRGSESREFDSPLPPSIWQEVPAARFLSWTWREQLAYCAARDEDSAKHAENDEWQQFYENRARGYRNSQALS
ncbi:MAG: hypothetical protein NUV51_09450 [Sulfuricaulis sp.]|nr:hypothetical protein [Sulfuricaulis sp.]